MNYQITQKLAAVALAVLMNGVMFGTVSCLFTAPATAMSQAVHALPGAAARGLGVA